MAVRCLTNRSSGLDRWSDHEKKRPVFMLWQIQRLGLQNQNTVALLDFFPLLFQTVQDFMLLCRRRNSITLRRPLQNPHWMISKVHGDDNLKASWLRGPQNLQPMFAEKLLSHFATRCVHSKLLAPTPSSG